MMIFRQISEGFEVVSFDDLKALFPNTSFCKPLKQSALPEGYVLAEEHDDAKMMPKPVQKNKRTVASTPFEQNGKWFFGWVFEEPTEEELNKAIDVVDEKVSSLMSQISWAFADDVNERVRNKYQDKRKQILGVYEQEGFPFHVIYPEI